MHSKVKISWYGMALVSLLAITGWAGIPSQAERIQQSGLNPEYCTWKAIPISHQKPIKVGKNEPAIPVGFRYDFDLPAEPRRASLTLYALRWMPYELSVNGQAVSKPFFEKDDFKGRRTVDVTKAFRKGRNVICLKGNARSIVRLTLEGIVFCNDGSIVRILTGDGWKSGVNPADGWDDPDKPADALPDARILGKEPQKCH